MKTCLIVTACLLLCLAIRAEDSTNAPSPWDASVTCLKDNVINGPVSPGDKVELTFFIRNTSTNVLALSKNCIIMADWKIDPSVVSNGLIRLIGNRSWGDGVQLQVPPWQGWINHAVEYAFFKPGVALRHTHTTTVPQVTSPATNIGYHAIFFADDTGNEFGLSAWTGRFPIEGFIVPLVQTNNVDSQHPPARDK